MPSHRHQPRRFHSLHSRPRRAGLLLGLMIALFALPGLRDGVSRPLVTWQTPDPALSLAFSADGTVLAVGGDGLLQLYNTPPLETDAASASAAGASSRPPHLGQLRVPGCTLRDFAFAGRSLSVYGRRRDCAGRSTAAPTGSVNLRPGPNRLALYDLATGTLAATPGPHRGELGAVRVHRSGQTMASASVDGLVRFWQRGGSSPQLTRSLRLPAITAPRRLSRPIAFAPDLDLLAVHDWRDYYVAILEIESGRVLHRSEYPFRAIAQPLFVFSPDGNRYFDGHRVRRSRSGEPVASIPFSFGAGEPPPGRAAFASDGQSLAVVYGSANGTALSRVRGFALGAPAGAGSSQDDTGAGRLIAEYALSEALRSLAWHPDPPQKILAVGAYSGRVFLYRP